MSNIDYEQLKEYYVNHSTKDTCSYFLITKKELIDLLHDLNIDIHTKKENISLTLKNKSADEKQLTEIKRKSTNQSKYGCDNVSQVKEISEKISNTRRNFTAEQRQHQIDAFRKTMLEKSDEELALIKSHRSEATKNYFANLSDKQKQEFSNKMSEVYKNLSDEIKENRILKIKETYKQTCLNKYGVSNILKLDDVKQKIINTNLDKYGVAYYCQTKNCRSALGGNSALSKPNIEFGSILDINNIEYDTEFVINNYSYDFKIDNLLIEINPTSTHNSTYSPFNCPKNKYYHYNKTKCAKENNYRCINIWDWDDTNKILFLIAPREIIYARKCFIKEVDLNISREFLNQYHLQNYVKSDIQIGLYFNDELVSLMTFGKPRYNKNYQYELLRYVTIKNVLGGAEKLFKYFLNKYSPNSIISYCDYSKFNGNVYEKLGFIYDNISIGKHWYNTKTKMHITDNLLRQRGYDQLFGTNYGKGTNNEILMLDNGFVEIYDAGQARYRWIKN